MITGRPNRLFILSPAYSGGVRARLLLSRHANFPLALQLQAGNATLGEVFSFMSGLYFRGKLAYAEAFANPPPGVPGVVIITPGAGLRAPGDLISIEELVGYASIEVCETNPLYRQPLEIDARRIAALVSQECEAVLLGSVATTKYVEVLLGSFGGRLRFPAEFVGRGDMSRGGLLLRCARSREELEYVAVSVARRGPRPPKLPKLR
jgi:hypothetical protein